MAARPTMKAAVHRTYGPPEVVHIEQVPRPSPKAREILVRVRATTVCAADWRTRKADPFIIRLMGGLSRPRKPAIPGMEFSGVVVEVGRQVARFRPGDEVFGSPMLRMGAHAQYLCLPEDGFVALKPANMGFDQAAAVAFGGLTALSYLRKAGVRTGQDVLIYGASGSVGVFAVQLARHFGARVTGVCSTANVAVVKSLGADRVIDYAREDYSKGGRIYDVVFDTVGKGGFRRALKVLRRGGVYVTDAPVLRIFLLGALWARLTGAGKVVMLGQKASGDDIALLGRLIEAGELTTVIDRIYPLDQIVEAHRLAESGHKKGHVVVMVD